MMKYSIEINEVTKVYHGREVLCQCTMRVPEGKIYGVLVLVLVQGRVVEEVKLNEVRKIDKDGLEDYFFNVMASGGQYA